MNSALLASPPTKLPVIAKRTGDGATRRDWPVAQALLWVCIATGALYLAYAFERTALLTVVCSTNSAREKS